MKNILIGIFLLLCFCGYGFSAEIDPTSSDALDFDMDFVDESDAYIDTYETIGQDITEFYEKATEMCLHEIVRYDKLCAVLKRRYEKLRHNYIVAGNIIIEGLKDDNKKEENIKKYRVLKAKILDELSKLYKLIGAEYDKEKIIKREKESY